MFDALLVKINTSYIHHCIRNAEPQLGLYYIAEFAALDGFEVKVKKYASHEPIVNNLLDLLKSNQCRILGFYVDSENFWTIRRILPEINQEIQDLFVVVGGPQVTGDPQLALKRIPSANCAIVGEGERPFLEILKRAPKVSKDLEKIKGVAYINNCGHFEYTGAQPSQDIDFYPFPQRKKYSLDPDIIFDQISTGRGCVGNCAFCFEGNKTENNLRLRSTDKVIEEIDYVISHLKDQHFFSFLDDTFIINPSRTRIICNHLIDKYKGEIGWFCEARVDILKRNVELLQLMRNAGLIRVQLGGESGSQKILDAYRKNMKIQDLKDVVNAIYEAGIPSIYVNFIIGGAFETIETFNETLELALELIDIAPGCVEVGCSLFSPYVGTPMRNDPASFGISIIDSDFVSGPDGFVPFISTNELSGQKILQLRNIFETEIRRKCSQIVKYMSKVCINNQYSLFRKYDMATDWLILFRSIESINNYFESILDYGFVSIDDLSIEEIQMCIPHRTCQPVSDGEYFYRVVYGDEYRKNTPLQNAVFFLSSGKLCFCEIASILKRNKEFQYEDDLEEKIYSVYKEFDKEYLIVWKCAF